MRSERKGMELKQLAEAARDGDVEAFTRLIRRYQQMAFGCALAMLGDFHGAQDAAQEAFLAAYAGMSTLREPAEFPRWLRAIVRHQCHRQLRRRHLETVPLEAAAEVAC